MGRESRDRRCGQRRSGYRCAAIDGARGIAENDRQLVCRGLCSVGSGKRGYKARRKSSWGYTQWEKSTKVVKAVDKVDGKVASVSKNSIDNAIQAKRASKAVATTPSRTARYFTRTSELNKHYAKHGKEVAKALGKKTYTKRNYLNDARYVVKSGKYVPEKNAYVKFIGGIGKAKFGYVGVTRDGKYITTFHIKKIGEIIKFASLGYKR